MITLELLQAINDWMATGIGTNKPQIAARLILHSKDLPDKFKTISSKCYRQVALTGMNSVLLGANMSLPETYSSWTFDKSVAQSFNGGVPPKGYQGVIFEVESNAPGFEVVLNLFELFKDSDFLAACKKHQNEITSYKSGIGYFMNSESEVILKINNLTTSQIWAYGGYSAPREKLAEMFWGRKPTSQDLKIFDKFIKQGNLTIGGNWLKGAGKDRIVKIHIATVRNILNRKK